MSDEGTSLIDRMYDRINTLKSRNDSLLALVLSVISATIAVAFFAVENGFFPSVHLLLLGFLYFFPAFVTACYCIRLVMPKKYSELTLFYEDFPIVSKADPKSALGHIVFSKRSVFNELDKKYAEDLEIHKKSLGWFVGSFFGLFVFALAELIYMFG